MKKKSPLNPPKGDLRELNNIINKLLSSILPSLGEGLGMGLSMEDL